MNTEQPLIIRKSDRIAGLRPYCKECKREIAGRKCGRTGKSLVKCESPQQHTYKAFVTIPGGGGKRKSSELNTKDLSEAIAKRNAFRKKLKENDFQSSSNHKTKREEKPMLLIECMAMYMALLNNVGVPSHLVKVRSPKHLWEVEDYFAKWNKALKKNKIDHTIFRIDQMNDKVVGMIHNYILDDLGHANKTYNKMISLYRRFTAWLIEKKKYEITNSFDGVVSRIVTKNNEIVSVKEFESLLKSITSENGYRTFKSGRRLNQYRPWLSVCFRLALETGLRTEEFMMMKFSHISCDEEGRPLFIEVPNYKVNRIKGESISDNRKFVPITDGMLLLLEELNYTEKKQSDNYLIGNDEEAARSTLMNLASKGFTHYWKLTGIQRTIHLKNLRKTYLTALVAQMGDQANIVSDHSSIDVIKKHYTNKQHIVSMVRNFAVFKQ